MTNVEEKEEILAAKDSEGSSQMNSSSAEMFELLENIQLEVKAVNDRVAFF